eukprot:3245647-Rhodomonas_salina.1
MAKCTEKGDTDTDMSVPLHAYLRANLRAYPWSVRRPRLGHEYIVMTNLFFWKKVLTSAFIFILKVRLSWYLSNY